MADWGEGSRVRSSSGASSSGSFDMVSPLTLKLQAVWLRTQIRSSSRDLNVAPATGDHQFSAAGDASVQITSPVAVTAAGTPSSSSESGDESWGAAVESARSNTSSNEDAVLKYIGQMLMEDQQQACLDLEVGVGAFQAELAELIQTSPPGSSSSLDQVSALPPPIATATAAAHESPPSSSPSSSSRKSSPGLKKRSLPKEEDKHFQLTNNRVSFLDQQSIQNIQRNIQTNGLNHHHHHQQQQQQQQHQGPRRPPRLLLQRNESFTALWGQMGLDSHLLDKLVLCGEAVSVKDYGTACGFIEDLRHHAAGREGNATQRVVFYFLEALIARMNNTGEKMFAVMCKSRSIPKTLKAVEMIVKLTPFLSLPHFFTNKIILEAIKGHRKVHIVDFGIVFGFQWPALFKLLAERSEGSPQVRITGIDLPSRALDHNGRIRETGSRLKRCAGDWGIPFKFKSLTIAWESVEPSTLLLKDDEVLIVCCSFKQTNLFDETVIAESPKNAWLTRIRNLNPKVFIQCLASSDFGIFVFMSRFQEALIHHAAVFAAMDACISRMLPERIVIEQDKYGREIMNIVACDGIHRVERSEKHQQWQARAEKCGMEILALSHSLFEECKHFARNYNRGLTVERDGDWIWLGWKNQIIHAYSAWRPSASP